MNKIISNVCKHIVNVFETQGKTLDYGEVLNKFEHFLTNESLVYQNRDVLDRIYGKCISDKRLVEFVNTQLFGKLNEGFYNPFAEEGDDDSNIFDDEYINVDDSPAQVDTQERTILTNDSCVNGKVFYKDGKMFSGVNMKTGDIIELCPVIPIDRVAMCSRSVRDLAFQIGEGDDEYGIPFGYANQYRTSEETGEEGNVDYEYPENGEIMKIVAIKDIEPNDELILRVESNPMQTR